MPNKSQKPKVDQKTGRIQSARRQLNRELPDNVPLRMPNIPGGKKIKGGRIGDDLVPPQHAIEISGGKLINDGRGNIVDSEQAIKGGKRGRPKKGAGILDTIGKVANIASTVAPLLALGKDKKKPGRPKKGGSDAHVVKGGYDDSHVVKGGADDSHVVKGGADDSHIVEGAGIFGDIGDGIDAVGSLLGLGKKGGAMGDSFVGVKSGHGKKKVGGIQQGALPVTMTNPLEQPRSTADPKKGAGIFGDIGNAIDAVGSVVGLGKKGVRAKRAEHKENMMKAVNELEAGVKTLKKSLRKIK